MHSIKKKKTFVLRIQSPPESDFNLLLFSPIVPLKITLCLKQTDLLIVFPFHENAKPFPFSAHQVLMTEDSLLPLARLSDVYANPWYLVQEFLLGRLPLNDEVDIMLYKLHTN